MRLSSNECSYNQPQHYFWELAILQNDSNFSPWNDQIISALLASHYSFLFFFLSFFFCAGSDLTKQWNYAWHSLIPHPEHKRGKMMSFMYEIFFFHLMSVIIVSIQLSRALVSGFHSDEHKGYLKHKWGLWKSNHFGFIAIQIQAKYSILHCCNSWEHLPSYVLDI